ncbi:L,D-transpeptidase [Streptomyces bluensis]|uniref:L,D-transpeptidase n=1 Tax=Streptomyces bluensis TaxID=33897 RepID=UPI0033245775
MSDDLTRGLRQLAKNAEVPPPVPGAEVRRVAVRRRRRRRTTAVAAGGTLAAALAALLTVSLSNLSGGADDRPAPAASPVGTPATPATADATVDLSREVLVIDGREFPVLSGSADAPTPLPTGRMTVTGKKSAQRESGRTWVITLRAPDGSTTFLGSRADVEEAPGDYTGTPGWIGLRRDEARWVYERLSEGSVVEVTGTAPTRDPAPPSAAPPAPSVTPAPTVTPGRSVRPEQAPAGTATPSAMVDAGPSGSS